MGQVSRFGLFGCCYVFAVSCGGLSATTQGGNSGASGSQATPAGGSAAAGAAGTFEIAGTAGTPIPVDVNLVSPSPGCGLPSGQALGQYVLHSTHVTGRTLDPSFSVPAHDRGYYVWLPMDYDERKPYRVTFVFMGCGDRYAANTGTYKFFQHDPEAIYVAMNMPPTGFPPEGKDCYDSTIGKQSVEWEFMGLTASAIQRSFCVDENRLFVSGYSTGAWVSNMFGCYFAGKDPTRLFGSDISIRGQGTFLGGPVQPDVPCGGKVAALWIHEQDDNAYPITGNLEVSLPRVLAVNGCAGGVLGPQAPWGSTPDLSRFCKQFTGCPAEYPVIFCSTVGYSKTAAEPLVYPGVIDFENLMNAK